MPTYKPAVVLVDDHVLLRNGLANLIRSFGEYTVLFEAYNGTDFIRQLQLKPRLLPDLVLLDINMPEMDGIEATKKANLLYRDINIIAVSFHDEMKFIKQMIEAGAKNYVIKEDLNKSILEKIILRH